MKSNNHIFSFEKHEAEKKNEKGTENFNFFSNLRKKYHRGAKVEQGETATTQRSKL